MSSADIQQQLFWWQMAAILGLLKNFCDIKILELHSDMSMGYSIICQNTHFISHNILCNELERYFIIMHECSLDINQAQSI